jgi:hypothetical protein
MYESGSTPGIADLDVGTHDIEEAFASAPTCFRRYYVHSGRLFHENEIGIFMEKNRSSPTF